MFERRCHHIDKNLKNRTVKLYEHLGAKMPKMSISTLICYWYVYRGLIGFDWLFASLPVPIGYGRFLNGTYVDMNKLTGGNPDFAWTRTLTDIVPFQSQHLHVYNTRYSLRWRFNNRPYVWTLFGCFASPQLNCAERALFTWLPSSSDSILRPAALHWFFILNPPR